jgi:hypothetical protein
LECLKHGDELSVLTCDVHTILTQWNVHELCHFENL